MTAISRGYLTLARSRVAIDDWMLGIEGEQAEQLSPGFVRDWNYYQAVRVRTVLRLDIESCRIDLGLAESDELCAAILWSSAGTNLRGRSTPQLVRSNENPLQLALTPGDLRSQLQTEVVLALARAGNSTNQLSPRKAGSVVWSSDRYVVDLEGLGSRMPVVAFPFSRRLAHSENAQWWLNVRSIDLDRPVDGALWMWLNEEHPHVKGLLAEPEEESSKRTGLHLTSDFHRQLLQMALSHEDLDMAVQYPAGSLGASLAGIVRLLDDDIANLRAQYSTDPWMLEARLQSAIAWRD